MVYTNGPQSVPIIHAQSQYDISMQQTTAEGYMYANNDVSLDPLLHDISAQVGVTYVLLLSLQCCQKLSYFLQHIINYAMCHQSKVPK